MNEFSSKFTGLASPLDMEQLYKMTAASQQGGGRRQGGGMNEIIAYRFEKKNIRTLLRDGEPWFVARDVGNVLGIADMRTTIRDFPASEADRHTMPVRSETGVV